MDPPECSICLDIFGNAQTHIKSPKILQCGDTFCKECLQDIIRRSKENYFCCPLCKNEINKENDIEKYITNKEVIKSVNSYFNLPEEEDVNSQPISYKIIALGSSGVGKTSILNRLKTDKFQEEHDITLGFDNFIYYVKYKNKKYKLYFYDTAGEEKYKSVTQNYLKGIDGVIFVFDLSNSDSFEDLKEWYQLYSQSNENVTGVIIGNKSDLGEFIKINKKDAESFAEGHGLKYFEVSAKTDKYIKKALVTLLNEMIQSNIIRYNTLTNISIDNQKKRKRCC